MRMSASRTRPGADVQGTTGVGDELVPSRGPTEPGGQSRATTTRPLTTGGRPYESIMQFNLAPQRNERRVMLR